MENIYKVKIKTNPDPRGLYPSERRYSASIVLGLSVCHLFFCGLALIFAFLTLLSAPYSPEEDDSIVQTSNTALPTESFFVDKFEENRRREVMDTVNSVTRFYLILTTLLLMIGCLLAGLTGLLAWKRWYMDNNIKWFFATSLLAAFLSTASVICAIVTIVAISQKIAILYDHPQVKIHLHVHILIASVMELIFALISTVISYEGMKKNYPDDMMMAKGGGKIEVNTIMKGNRKSRISPPDIINHFHMTEKFAKYFPKKDNNYLPKAESNSEYQERVKKFLSSHTTDSSVCKY